MSEDRKRFERESVWLFVGWFVFVVVVVAGGVWIWIAFG